MTIPSLAEALIAFLSHSKAALTALSLLCLCRRGIGMPGSEAGQGAVTRPGLTGAFDVAAEVRAAPGKEGELKSRDPAAYPARAQ